MDKLAQKLSEWFGSSLFIFAHIVWFGLWFPLGGQTASLTVIVSLEAIFLALLILRAQNVSEAHNKARLKEDLAATKRIEKMIKSTYKDGYER